MHGHDREDKKREMAQCGVVPHDTGMSEGRQHGHDQGSNDEGHGDWAEMASGEG